jgi:hypothetical protein
MSESRTPYAEAQPLSPEQQKLILTAHRVLELPRAVRQHPRYTERPTTIREKAGYLLGKMAGRASGVDTGQSNLLDRSSQEHRETRIVIKGLPGPEGVRRLYQNTTRNLDDDTEHEALYLLDTEVGLNPRASTNYNSEITVVTGRINLLEPLGDLAQIADLQTDFDNLLNQGISD